MLILNWIIILSTQIKLRKSNQKNPSTFKMVGYPFTSYMGIALILITVSGGLLNGTQRMGVLMSLGLIGVIFLSSFLFHKKKGQINQH